MSTDLKNSNNLQIEDRNCHPTSYVAVKAEGTLDAVLLTYVQNMLNIWKRTMPTGQDSKSPEVHA